MGRWINRNPIAESGGANVYGFVGNDGVNRWDINGLAGYELHHIIPEWLARYSAYGSRTQGLRILLTHNYHMGASTGLHQRGLSTIRRLYQSGSISYYGAHSRVLLFHLKNAPGMIRDSLRAAREAGRNPIVWGGGATAVANSLGYPSLAAAGVSAAGLGVVAGGAIFTYWAETDIIKSFLAQKGGAAAIFLWNSDIAFGGQRGKRTANETIDVLMSKLCCKDDNGSKRIIKKCHDRFRNQIMNKYSFLEAIYALPDVDFPVKEARKRYLEIKFVEMLDKLEKKPKPACVPKGELQ